MAEFVGLAASVSGLLEITSKITQLSYIYVCDIRNASKTQKQYLQEVSAFTDTLFRAEQAIQEAEATGLVPARPASLNDDVLQDCHMTLSSLQMDLEKQLNRFLWPFQERELRKHINSLRRFRDIFVNFLSANILVATNATYKKVEVICQEQDRHQLLARIPSSDAFMRSSLTPCPGTGQWFLHCEKFELWQCGPPTILWCYGAPGVGKSLLASLAIEQLSKKCEEMNSSVAYCFCDFSSREQQKPVDIIRYLLRQLVEQGDGQLVSALKKSCVDPVKLANLKDLARTVAEACALKLTYLVVDGPDELNDPDGLLSLLQSFVDVGCRVLVTSRDLPNIRRKLGTAESMEVRSTVEDLMTYVEYRFRESEFSIEASSSNRLVHEIVTKTDHTFLLAKLMLDQLLELTTIRQIREALELQPPGLDQAFQSSLNRINAQSPAKRTLARRLLNWVIYTKRRLRVDEVVCAFAVEEESDKIHSESFLSPDLLVRVCVGLVMLDEKNGTLGMVHASTYEFFQNNILSSREANFDIAKICLHYLSMSPLTEGPCKNSEEATKRLEQMTFLNYSAKHWGEHLQDGHVQKDLEAQVLKILDDENLRSSSFQALHFLTNISDAFFKSIPTGQDGLHIAAYWNLVHIAEVLLKRGMNSSSVDSQKWTPLHWACSNGHHLVADLLVKNGAEVNAQDSQGWTPLFWAAFVGNLAVVRLLLSNRTNYLVRSVLGWTALHWAISRGEYAVVKELLDHHSNYYRMSIEDIRNLSFAEANLLAPEGIPPVLEAADAENTPIFDLLVAHLHTSGAKVGDPAFNEIWSQEGFDHPVSNPWRTLTKGERVYGLEGNVPDISDSWSFKRSSSNWRSNQVEWKSVLLLSAIRDSQYTAVELLIKIGADVNYSTGGTTPLHLAALRKDPTYARILLRNGADPGNVDSKGQTALHQAILTGFIETIKTIIDGGGDVNKPVLNGYLSSFRNTLSLTFGNYDYDCVLESSTSLIQACGFILEDRSKSAITMDIVHLLLSKGADPCIKDKAGMTVLHYAALQPFLPLIRLLIGAGAKVETIDNVGRMPLHFLAKYSGCDCGVDELRDIIQIFLRDPQGGVRTSLLNRQICRPSKYDGDSNSGIPPVGSTRLKNMLPKVRRRLSRQTSPDSLGRDSPHSTSSSFEIVFKRTQISTNYTNLSKDSEEQETPVSLALKNSCWKVFGIFSELGAAIPENLHLEPMLENAVKDLDANMVGILIEHGVHTTNSLVLVLIESLSSTISAESAVQDISAQKFQDILPVLISAKANVNYVDPVSNLTPLGIAAKMRISAKVILELLNSGADAYYCCSQLFDPILTAAIYRNQEALCCLMDHVSRFPKANHWSKYLSTAISQDTDSFCVVCSCLERAGQLDRVNRKGQALLHLAAERGNCQLINALLLHNANSGVEDSQGWLPVHYAGFSGHADAVECLLQLDYMPQNFEGLSLPPGPGPQRRDILEKRNKSGETMFQLAVKANNAQMVSHLLKLGADMKSEIEYLRKKLPPLYHAANQGHEELLFVLLAHGASVETSESYGWRPLHAASYNGHISVVKALITSGAEVCAATTKWNNDLKRPSGISVGQTWTGHPLHLAAMCGHVAIVRFLLEHGADVQASTGRCYPGQGPTALHVALDTGTFYCSTGKPLDEGRLEIAQMLVDRGAGVNGIADNFDLQKVLKFKKFPGLWDVLRAGISVASVITNL